MSIHNFHTSISQGGSNGRILKLFCDQCESRTFHEVTYSIHEATDIDDGDMFGWGDHCIVRCKGCDHLKYCTISFFSEDIDGHTGRPEERIIEYPSQPSQSEFEIHRFSMQKEVEQIYLETYKALQGKMVRLSGIGIRSIIETLCASFEITDNTAYTLDEKIDQLLEQQVISLNMKKNLPFLKEFGDRCAHTAYSPSLLELGEAWRIINYLLSDIYGNQESTVSYLPGFQKRNRRKNNTD